jgi:NADPH2:quinone reductase
MGKGRTNMRAMRAERFSGYEALRLVDLPKPAVTDGKVLVRITAAGVTPLDYTILSGNFHIPEVPLVLGNEGAGVVEEGGGAGFSRRLTRDVLGCLWRFRGRNLP